MNVQSNQGDHRFAESEEEKLKEPVADAMSKQHGLTSSRLSVSAAGEHGKLPSSFRDVGLHGRDADAQRILTAYRRASSPSCSQSEVVFVTGEAGVGKSFLINSTLPKMQGALVTEVKFDKVLHDTSPLTAMIHSFDSVVRIIATSQDFTEGRRHDILKQFTQFELTALSRALPSFDMLMVGQSGRSQASSFDENKIFSQGMPEVRYILRKMLSVLATPERPIVTVFEGLHLTEHSATLQKLCDLLCYAEYPSNVLLICTYVDDHPSAKVIRQRISSKSSLRTELTRLHLRPLDLASTSSLITDVVGSSDVDEVSAVADLVHKKTRGLPLLVLHYVDLLKDSGAITTDTTSKLVFDPEKGSATACRGIDDLLMRKLERLDPNVLRVLQIASVIGFAFDKEMLSSVIGKKANHHLLSQMDVLLDVAQSKSFIRPRQTYGRKNVFCFAHDHVHASVHAMTPDANQLHLLVGRLIHATREKSVVNVCMSFSHINMGVTYLKNRQERVEVARMNLEAGKRVMDFYAYVMAAGMFEAGTRLLEGGWDTEYSLCLELHFLWADMVRINQDLDGCEKLIKEIKKRTKKPADQLKVNCLLIDVLGTRGKFDEAMQLGWSVLRENKERLPSRPNATHVTVEVAKMKRLLNGRSDEQLLSLPPVKDDRELSIHNIYDAMLIYAPLRADEKQTFLLMLRAMQSCVRSGASFLSPQAFAKYGLAQAIQGNDEEAYRYGKLAMNLLDNMGRTEGRGGPVITTAYAACFHWRENVSRSLNPLWNAYKSGLAVGETKSAFFAIQSYFVAAFQSGVNLEELEPKMRECCKKTFNRYKDGSMLLLARPLWQAVMNLMGGSDSPHILIGEALNQIQFVKEVVATENQEAMMLFRLLRMQLSHMFGAYDTCHENLDALEQNLKAFEWNQCVYEFWLFQGLVYLMKIKHNKKRKHCAKIKKLLKKLESLASSGNPNARPVLLLLQAEQSTLDHTSSDKANAKVLKAFDQAIEHTRNCRHTKMEALCSERAWEACREMGEEESAEAYLRRAIALNARWGAKAKVEYLVANSDSTKRTGDSRFSVSGGGSSCQRSTGGGSCQRSTGAGSYQRSVRSAGASSYNEDSMASPPWCP